MQNGLDTLSYELRDPRSIRYGTSLATFLPKLVRQFFKLLPFSLLFQVTLMNQLAKFKSGLEHNLHTQKIKLSSTFRMLFTLIINVQGHVVLTS